MAFTEIFVLTTLVFFNYFDQFCCAVVETDCGPVQGTLSIAYSYKGIPYALPPTKDLRWKPPVPLNKDSGTCWNGTLMATSFGNECYQRDFLDSSKSSGSEDCLFLNVWTPTNDSNANLPVMVWIHGGSLQNLNGNYPTYSPSEELAAKTNVVYVSMNYRMSAFGFMALDLISEDSPLNVSGNYGFMDQQLALNWVKRNIRKFGGNPNLVTAFGQSSGGTSMIALLASPLSKGLFQRALLLSASPVYNKSLADASRDNLKFVQNTRCSTLQCLKSLSAETVLRAIPWDVYPNWAMADQPNLPKKDLFDGAICIVDGYVVPEPPFEVWRNGKGIDVPVIVGTAAQELDYASTFQDLNSWTWNNYTEVVHLYLDTFPGNITAQALQLYPVGVFEPGYQYTTMASDLRVTCGNNIMAEVMSNNFKSNVYRYIITQKPSYPVHILGLPVAAKYSPHLWDILGYFDSIKHYYQPMNNDKMFTELLQDEFVYFAIHGRPRSDIWQPYPKVALISANISTNTLYHSNECNFWNRNDFFKYSLIN